MVRCLVLRIASLTLALLATAPAFADGTRDAEAKALFQAGREAFEGGRYEAALARWQEAYDISGRPALLYNLGLAHDRLRHDDKALWAFKAYLAQVSNIENREEVEGRIKALETARDERNAVVAPAPSPTETANQSEVAATTRSDSAFTVSEPRDTPTAKPLTKQWWFWTGVGAVLVGGVVIAIAASSGGGQKDAAPIESRSGVTVMTLTRTR
jgi:tetratricopeptide (TPR) repeat protein